MFSLNLGVINRLVMQRRHDLDWLRVLALVQFYFFQNLKRVAGSPEDFVSSL